CPKRPSWAKTREEVEIPGVDSVEWGKLLADMAAHRSFRNFQHPRKRPDGRVVHLSINGKAIFDEAGKFRGYRGSDSDVTEYERTRESLATAHDELEMRVAQRTEELRRSNDRLRGEEAKLREILENSPVGVAITTRKKDYSRAAGERLLVNSALIRMFGEIDREGFLKTPIEDSWVDLDQLAAVREVLKGGGDLVDFEAQRRRKDGTTWWVSMNTRPIKLDDQDCTMVWHFDITERKEAEGELRKNEALIRALIDHLPVLISIKDLDGRYTFVSPAFTRFMDMTAEQVIGKKFSDLHSPEASAILKTADQAVLKSGAALQSEETFPVVLGSSTLLLTKFPIQDGDGNTISIGTIGIDITEQMRAEEALRMNEAYLSALIETNPSSIFLKDLDGRYLLINSAFEKSMSLDRNEIIGRTT
ncbi:MAG: PAS domain S-box protein, partial [Alphaproteobacteria bacterium]|nr:PAS domain S-box protein [Alphaproteobacteria bacterium]